MNGEEEEEEESEGIPAVNRLVLSLHFMVVHFFPLRRPDWLFIFAFPNASQYLPVLSARG